MTGKEYLEEQIQPLHNNSYSLLQYPEEDFFRCPYCGEKMKQTFEGNGNVFRMWCDCEGAKDEKLRIERLNIYRKEYEDALRAYEDWKEECENIAKDAGIKFAAQHYMSLKEQRDKFDSEIEQLAK